VLALPANAQITAVASAVYTISPDFAFTINPASITVKAGQRGTSTIGVTDVGGFNGANLSFVCSGLPAGAGVSSAWRRCRPIQTPTL